MNQIYVALDIETTGLWPETDAIIEIGMVKFRADGEVLGTWATLINPQVPIPLKIQHLTGIKPADVRNAPLLRDVVPALRAFVKDYPIVGHNIQFDLGFLAQKGIGLVNGSIDTFELASIVLPKMPSYNLEQLTKALDIPSPTYHRALADANLAKDLFLALIRRALDLDLETVQEINRLAARGDWGLRGVFGNIEREKTRFGLSSSIREQLRAKGKLDLLAQEGAKAPGRLTPTEIKQPLDVEYLAAILDQGGLLSRHFPGYEHRPQQIQMLRAVAEAFNNDECLLVEAGTGVGKSLSYLIPAVFFAATNGQRVVISTNTINLQDQLYNKDIPDLQTILSKREGNPRPLTFTAALVKGRSNYLCLRRWASFRQKDNFSPDEIRLAAKILVWLPITLTGDRAELTITTPAENAVWNRLSAQAETCSPDTCVFFQRNQCFLYRARRQAEAAHIVVINHALLISDLVTENRVLPEFSYLIIDEAHHLEDVATDQLGFAADRQSILALLDELSPSQNEVGKSSEAGRQPMSSSRLKARTLELALEADKTPSRGSPAGFLSEIPAHFRGSSVPPEAAATIQVHIGETHARLQRARGAVYEFFNILAAFVTDRLEETENGWITREEEEKQAYDQPIRLTAAVRSQPAWSQVEIAWDNLAKNLLTVEEGLGKIYRALEDLAGKKVLDYEALLADVQAYLNRLQALRQQGTAIISQPQPTGIYWLTISPNGNDITLHAAPLHVGDILAQQLFSQKDCVILTSATLTTEGGFRYLRERLGLYEARELCVGSPFDYRSSTLLLVPGDMPEPGKPGYQQALHQGLVELAKATRGRMLVLFTSHSAVRAAYKATSPLLESEGITVLGHAIDGQPRQLVERFKVTPRCVLMGTSALWEGVDVVGEALSALVIAKLPFSVPSDPVFSARSEWFDDPFNEYAVPQAVLKFKQGFGRLIRSKTDRGVVIILDRRVVTKAYGRAFLESLPPCTVVKDMPLSDLPRLAEEWLENKALVQGTLSF